MGSFIHMQLPSHRAKAVRLIVADFIRRLGEQVKTDKPLGQVEAVITKMANAYADFVEQQAPISDNEKYYGLIRAALLEIQPNCDVKFYKARYDAPYVLPLIRWKHGALDFEFGICELPPDVQFQTRVALWANQTFTPEHILDTRERNHRFLEEALELTQSLGLSKSDAHNLVDYVFNRPKGDPFQELGGVMTTLAVLSNAHNMNMNGAANAELDRIWDCIEKIRAKQAGKPREWPEPEPKVLTEELLTNLSIGSVVGLRQDKFAITRQRISRYDDYSNDVHEYLQHDVFTVHSTSHDYSRRPYRHLIEVRCASRYDPTIGSLVSCDLEYFNHHFYIKDL